MQRAQVQGYAALALTDECSLAGVVRAHVALKRLVAAWRERAPERDPELELPHLILGSQFAVHGDGAGPERPTRFHPGGPGLPARGLRPAQPVHHRPAPRLARQGALPPDPVAPRPEGVSTPLPGCVLLLVPERRADDAALLAQARWLQQRAPGRGWLGVTLLRELGDERWLQRLRQVSGLTGVPLVACGDVHFHVRSRKPLQDVMTAIRLGTPVAACGFELQPHAERHLRSRVLLAQVYPPDLLAATLAVAERCHFSLDELRHEYPSEVVPLGRHGHRAPAPVDA